MIEQLIDNWLTKASEKSFQIPFCFILSSEGHTILHLTRHCGMEHGKDIITMDPTGTPCAYQLKGAKGKIKLRSWRKDLLPQLYQLTHHTLMHPSVPIGAPHHRSYFVTNGELDEEVSSVIANDNNRHEINHQPELKLNVIVKGQLIEKGKKLGLNFIPPDFNDFRLLLEFYLEDGLGTLDKEKFSYLLEGIFNRSIKPTERGSLLRGSAIIVALATTSYSNKENHVALAEAWMIYLSYLLRFAETHKLPKKGWINEFNIAEQIVVTSIENLWNECRERSNFLIGSHLEDSFVHGARSTWILGLISCLALHYKFRGINSADVNDIHSFCQKHKAKLELYGEAAVPNFLAFYWLYRIMDATEGPAKVLSSLLNTVLSNIRKPDVLYAEPYYSIDECVSLRWERDKKVIEEKNQKGTSYYVEGLMHLFVRENYKQRMLLMWPEISKVFFKAFRFKEVTDFYRWRNKEGSEVMTTPPPTKRWPELKNEAAENGGIDIPILLKERPYLYILFINVFPFRGSGSGLRWFDTVVNGLDG